jgi:hypothetical protein
MLLEEEKGLQSQNMVIIETRERGNDEVVKKAIVDIIGMEVMEKPRIVTVDAGGDTVDIKMKPLIQNLVDIIEAVAAHIQDQEHPIRHLPILGKLVKTRQMMVGNIVIALHILRR